MSYRQRLSRHPGLIPAALFTLLGAVAGMERGEYGWLIGAAIGGGWMWPIVLWTARSEK